MAMHLSVLLFCFCHQNVTCSLADHFAAGSNDQANFGPERLTSLYYRIGLATIRQEESWNMHMEHVPLVSCVHRI